MNTLDYLSIILYICIVFNFEMIKMISPGCTHSANAFKDAHFAQVHQRRQHIEHLEDQITELAAHIHAATFRLLELVREYDECEGWGGKGLISCAHWLNWKCGIALGTAREKVAWHTP